MFGRRYNSGNAGSPCEGWPACRIHPMAPSEGQSRAALQRSAFIDGIPALAWSALPDGTLDFCNQPFCDYTGFSSDQLYRSGWKSAVHQDDTQQFETWWRDLRQSSESRSAEVRLRRFDGEYRWFQIAAAPLHDTQGTLVRWYGISIDIHHRKCNEQELRQDEQQLRTITDAIRQSIVVLAPDGTTLYANRVALDQTGVTVGEVNDKGFFARVFHPDDTDRVREERRIGLLEGLPFELEMRARFKNGQYRWQLVQYDPLKDERGETVHWYVTATDIDDQKRTEERIRNENLVLREEIDQSSMFEEIIGSSKPIRLVVGQVEKVAPSDST